MLLPVLLVPSCLWVCLVSTVSAQKLRTVHQWAWVDYLWDSEADRAAAIKSGDYNYTRPIIIDSDLSKDGRVFVTVIKLEGVPASLTTVSNVSGNGGPLLKPYPDWSWARRDDCDGITSVYRVAIDECNRLWAIDNGKIGRKKVCPHQLLVFDLNTDRLIRRVKIPDNVSTNSKTGNGLLVTPIVETEGRQCQRTYVYIADVQGNALVIYNGTWLWRLDSSVYGPQDPASDFEIAGESFHLPDGVLGMALSPNRRSRREPRYLVFRPLASYDMLSAETWNLRRSYDDGTVRYTIVPGILPSQAVAMAFSSQGILFFGLSKETALACWNLDKPVTKENIVLVDQNETTLQFPSGLKVIPEEVTRDSEQVWMVTNRYQKIAVGSQDLEEINYRIMAGRVDDLIADTNCDPRTSRRSFFDHQYRPRQADYDNDEHD